MPEMRMSRPELRHPHPAAPASAPAAAATVLHDDRVIRVSHTRPDPARLWVTPEDLTRINGFELKPEGACLGELCIPIRKESGLLAEQDGRRWFDLTGFASTLGQACVADAETRTYSFGEIPEKRRGMVEDAEAPDFALPDRRGETIRLSSYRGKKVLIVTWSSW